MKKYLEVVKEYARDYVVENTGLKVLALLITAVLWLSIASRPVNRVTLRDVPIEFGNLPSPSLIVSKKDALVAQVSVEGPRDAIDALRSGEVVVVADMSDVEPGVRVIRLKLDTGRLPSSVKVREVEPRTIGVTVERVIEKEVPIKPRFDGPPPDGFELIGWQIMPHSVRVSGAESQMRDVAELSTETVSLARRTESFTIDPVAIYKGALNLNIIDEGGTDVRLNVTIGEVRKERVLDKVPVALFGAPSRVGPVPRLVKVRLFGAASAIDAMTAADVSVAIEYDQPSPRPGQFTPRVTIAPSYSELVTVRSVEPATVRIR